MKKIGYTTGVFDLFHIGHLNILKRAKLECDYLIVGITTDELSKSAKNKEPVIPFQERMEIVEAIKFVDEVVPQVNYDKEEAWNNLKFDKMFVGDDWKGRFPITTCHVEYFPYTKSVSSTILKETLKIQK